MNILSFDGSKPLPLLGSSSVALVPSVVQMRRTAGARGGRQRGLFFVVPFMVNQPRRGGKGEEREGTAGGDILLYGRGEHLLPSSPSGLFKCLEEEDRE